MSLPRFLDRVLDAAVPVLGGLDRAAAQAKLEQASVTLVAGERARQSSAAAGVFLAANLMARLYPRIGLEGPEQLVREAANVVLAVNPRAEVIRGRVPAGLTLAFEGRGVEGADVAVFARGWNVLIDTSPRDESETAAPAALLAAAIGVGEIFRMVFAEELGDRGRRGPQPGAFNVVTLGEPIYNLPVPASVELGDIRLVGAGALGESAAHTLLVAGARGRIRAIDPERVALSNLQRYVLTRDTDVDAVKVELLRERLAGSGLEVIPVAGEWHAALVDEQLPTLVALDSPEGRLGVQASLPGPIYNAWTQPADVGWSRHERFGDDPCLGCLYWPDSPRPSRHEQIAAAFRQHPLRVLAYLVHRLPIGLPLPAGGVPAIPDLPAPPEAHEWIVRPLADDIAIQAGVDGTALDHWRERPLADVYQDGICGGALLHLDVGEAPRETLVPLAHQSAVAGIMLAVQLLAARVPQLRSARHLAVESRFDVLAGLPQVLPRPRARTATCLCSDSVFLDVYRVKVQPSADANGPATVEEEVT